VKTPPARISASWIAGTLIACAGVVVARWVAPQFIDPARAWFAVGGQLLGVGGLFVIALGVRRRLRAAPRSGPDDREPIDLANPNPAP